MPVVGFALLSEKETFMLARKLLAATCRIVIETVARLGKTQLLLLIFLAWLTFFVFVLAVGFRFQASCTSVSFNFSVSWPLLALIDGA